MFPEIPWETSLKLPQDRLSRTKRSTPWRMTLLADIPSLMRTSCANHLQREHTKVSSFAFDGLVLLLRFCAGLFLTLLQHVASQNNSVTKMCVQIDFRALQPFSAIQTSLGSSPLTKHPVTETAFGGSLPDGVCASPVLKPRLDAKTRVPSNFIEGLFNLFPP